jgi:beta-mannosidase
MYAGVFQQVIPTTINKITPNIPYWETSPSVSSSYVETISSGDIHFWRVWGGGTPL